ncbi:MAG: hypothetical protein R3Y05_03830 [bacterium]
MKLKNLITFNRSCPISRENTSINFDIPYIHYGDVYKKYNNKLNIQKNKNSIIKVNNEYYNPKFQIQHNDIIMNLTSENHADLGKCILIENELNEKIMAGMETHLIKIISDLVLPNYLNYYFQSNLFLKTISQYITGMKVYRVKPIDILNINISLHDIKIQQHIIDIIEFLRYYLI